MGGGTAPASAGGGQNLKRRLNGIDALMLYLDGGSAYNHTLKISVLDPSTDPDGWSWPKVRRMFEERVHLLPVLRLRYLPTPRASST